MEATELYFGLMARGFTYRLTDSGLYVDPMSELSDEDKGRIKQHKAELVEMIKDHREPNGKYKMYIPCLSCSQPALLQDATGWFFCPYDRRWMREEEGKLVLV